LGRNVYINQAIQEDGDFVPMSHEAKLAWCMLKLDPRMGISGLARMTWKSLREVIDLPEAESRAVLEELTRKPWFLFDEEKGLLWLVDAFRHERNRSPAVMKAVVREIESCPRSHLLREWWKEYEPAFHAEKEGKRAISIYLEGASRGPRGSLVAPLARDSGPVLSGPVLSCPPEGGVSKHEMACGTAAPVSVSGVLDPPDLQTSAPTPSNGTSAIDRSRGAVTIASGWKTYATEGLEPDHELCTVLGELEPIGIYRDSGKPVYAARSRAAREAVKAALANHGGAELQAAVVIVVEGRS